MRHLKLDDPDLPLADLFRQWPACVGDFLRRKMLCPGCPVAPFHTVIDACEEYELDETQFRECLQATAKG